MTDDDPTRKGGGPMDRKPRVPVGPRRPTPAVGSPADGVGSEPTVLAAPRASGTPPTRNAPSERPPPERARRRSRAARRTARAGARTGRVRRWALRLVIAGAVLGVLGVSALAGAFVYFGRDLPDVHDLRAHWHPPQTTRILARDGSLLAEIYLERRTVVPMANMPENLVRAVLAAEDADFYQHAGLDYPGMLRALVVNLRHGTTAQGASTITQQVVKNVLLSSERTFARKFREVLLARRIEEQLSKNDILYLYLNHIAFGHGRNGVEEAARFYFGKHVNELTLGECALLAGVPKSPVLYSPRSHPDRARTRRHWILGQMVRNQFVTQAEADAADAEPIRIVDADDEAQGIAPEVVELVRDTLRRVVGDHAIQSGGYTIRTTIDPDLQREARAAVQTGLRDLDARQGYVGPLTAPGVRRVRGRPGWVLPGEAPPADGRLLPGRIYGGLVESAVDPDPAQRRAGTIRVRVGDVVGEVVWNQVARYVSADVTPSVFAPQGSSVRVAVDRVATSDAVVPMRLELGPQAAMVVIDPATREVRALVGGYDALAGMFDRSRFALRQAGSSFKPFLYSYAVHSRRYTLASRVDPNPACFGRWCPREAHTSPLLGAPPEAPMFLRDGLAQSRNMIAARLVTDLGPQALADHARELGISSRLQPVPALALGASDVTLMDMTNAYATWNTGGRWEEPTFIVSVQGPGGVNIPLPQRRAGRTVLRPEEAWLVTSLLTSVIQAPHATGGRARELRRPVAGKTGTSNDARDAWFVGYTPDLVVGTWVGFDDRQPLGRGEEGARSALPMWVQFVRRYVSLRHPPAIDFARPADLVSATIDPASGLLAAPGQTDGVTEYFLPGTQPTQVSVAVAAVPDASFATPGPDASPEALVVAPVPTSVPAPPIVSPAEARAESEESAESSSSPAP